MTEAEFIALVQNGSISSKTLVRSATRTKNQWVVATRIPAVAKHLKRTENARVGQAITAQPSIAPSAVVGSPASPTNPYAAPITSSNAGQPTIPSAAADGIYQRFQPLNSTIVMWLVRATMLAMAINAMLVFCFVVSGRSNLPTLATFQIGMVVLQILLLLVTAIFFLRWKFQAYANLQVACEQPLKTTPAWIVAVYFIPILNLFRPATGMLEIQARSKAGIGGLVLAWWILVILGGVLDRVAMSAPGSDNKAGHFVAFLGICLTLAAGYLLLRIIRTITEKQRRYRLSLAGHTK